ncbi:MAG: hypothetical protein EAZ57_09615 [Cytophagales bacterium]|nr:MAG: hypothetical protein EAZ67_01355 [Cytophagales bacterium]TAF59895.1 MAG: hypothetical protein EAZ57_09615 [Cytophagales bacterium]
MLNVLFIYAQKTSIMKFATIFQTLTFALWLCSLSVNAQMSKDETKKWKARQKEMTVESFKSAMDEYEVLKGETSGLKREVSVLNKSNLALQNEIDSISKLVEAKNAGGGVVKNTKKTTDPAKDNPQKTGGTDNFASGLAFRVQIGAFSTKDLMNYAGDALPCNCNEMRELIAYAEQQRFKPEEHDGKKKYTVGVFRDYWEADLFKNYLCEMGVKGAFVVAYKDSQRVADIKEVLSAEDVDAIQKHLRENPCGRLTEKGKSMN